MSVSKVCVLIPAYNEGKVIREVVANARACFKKSKHSIDIIVINDGSTDDTSSNAEAGGAHVIDHIINSGAGGATATGLRYAKKHHYDIAATMDADGQHSPKDVVTGIEEMQNNTHELLIGSRLIDSTGMSKVKVIGNKGLSLITYILFGIATTDSQSGLRIFSKRAINELRWQTMSYEFCSEMLWRAKQKKMSVGEYPIEAIYTEYSKSKGQNNWNAINIIKSLLKRRIAELLG